ncbi:MAG: hypothetical protein ACREMY_09250 [bacterium]
MVAVRQALRVAGDNGFAVPVRRQPPLVTGYEHFRLERQSALLSPKTLIYYDEQILWSQLKAPANRLRAD